MTKYIRTYAGVELTVTCGATSGDVYDIYVHIHDICMHIHDIYVHTHTQEFSRQRRAVRREGLVFKAHRLVYHSALGWRVNKKKKKKVRRVASRRPTGNQNLTRVSRNFHRKG